jgi:hypothetical protein
MPHIVAKGLKGKNPPMPRIVAKGLKAWGRRGGAPPYNINL